MFGICLNTFISSNCLHNFDTFATVLSLFCFDVVSLLSEIWLFAPSVVLPCSSVPAPSPVVSTSTVIDVLNALTVHSELVSASLSTRISVVEILAVVPFSTPSLTLNVKT